MNHARIHKNASYVSYIVYLSDFLSLMQVMSILLKRSKIVQIMIMWWGRWDLNLDLRARCRKVKSIIATFALTPQLPSLFLWRKLFLPRQVWQEMKQMNGKIVNCPHCGKILSPDFLEGKIRETVKCPKCGSLRVWKNAHHRTATGEVLQRYLCRDCEYRFSTR